MKLKYSFFVAALACLLAACSTDQTVAPSGSNIVNISASIGSKSSFGRSNPLGTATEQAQFNVGDSILVNAYTADYAYNDTVIYKFNGSTWEPQDGKFLLWNDNPLNFGAGYPASIHQKYYGEEILTHIPTDQTTLAKIERADIMNGYVGSLSKIDKVEFVMQRAISRVVVKIAKFGSEFDAATASVTDVKFVFTPSGGEGTVREYLPYAQGTGAVGSTYIALLPMEYYQGTVAVSMTVGGKTLTAPIPLGENGKSYTYNLTVGNDSKPIVGRASISGGWSHVADVPGTIE